MRGFNMTDQSKGRRLKIKAKGDFIDRLAQAPRIAALEELIWNSFDERAHRVEVVMTKNPMGGVDQITITDDGQSLFVRFGCGSLRESWQKQ
jgi:Histidine kinase-, DNA gyrase B-, and HSP90-like ATPase